MGQRWLVFEEQQCSEKAVSKKYLASSSAVPGFLIPFPLKLHIVTTMWEYMGLWQANIHAVPWQRAFLHSIHQAMHREETENGPLQTSPLDHWM